MKGVYTGKVFIIVCLLWIIQLPLSAQTTITGTVVDKDNRPIPGARVELSGTTEYAVTDIDGTFRMELPSPDARLNISYPGLRSLECKPKPDMVVRLGRGWGEGAKGYRGFFDMHGGFVFGDKINVYANGLRITGLSNYLYFGLTTTHGYQINRHLFVGAGIGIFSDAMKEDDGIGANQSVIGATIFNVPIFADVRWDFGLTEKTAPFVGVKVGYQLGFNSPDMFITEATTDWISSPFSLEVYCHGAGGIFFQPTIGLRTEIGGKRGFNMGLSYNLPFRKRFTVESNGQIYSLGVFTSSVLMLNLGIDF